MPRGKDPVQTVIGFFRKAPLESAKIVLSIVKGELKDREPQVPVVRRKRGSNKVHETSAEVQS